LGLFVHVQRWLVQKTTLVWSIKISDCKPFETLNAQVYYIFLFINLTFRRNWQSFNIPITIRAFLWEIISKLQLKKINNNHRILARRFWFSLASVSLASVKSSTSRAHLRTLAFIVFFSASMSSISCFRVAHIGSIELCVFKK